MSVTEAAGQTTPSWWRQASGPSGEADPAAADTGGTGGEFGFGDLIDVINPLQHLPVIGTLYREITGDQISETARMAGGTLWGGPMGLIGALANTITERETGQDIGATALAFAQEEAGRGEDGGNATGRPSAASEPQALASAPEPEAPGQIPAPSEAVQQFAGLVPAAGSQTQDNGAAHPAAQSVAQSAPGVTPAFAGRSADRLDAFIRRAGAVRSTQPQNALAQNALAQNTLAQTASTAPIALRAEADPMASTSRPAAKQPTPAPLKLATDGNTDVAKWMMRALDRYDSMKESGQS